MDPTLYIAAVKGITVYGEFILADVLQREDEENGYQVTPKGNTVLHVASFYGHSHFVGEVLKITPALLYCKNKKNETALHLAAANKGHEGVVGALISVAGEGNKEALMRMTDDNGDTALHKAVRSGCVDTVRLLVKEDPEFEFPANNAGETPLYLAAESGFHDCLLEILKFSIRPTYGGPCGRTALHAAIIQEHWDCVTSLWQWNKPLCEVSDRWGWNSLHYAVYLGLKGVVSDMLGWKKSLVYLQAGSGNDWTTAVHIAASEGDLTMLRLLINHCPDCREMFNSRGQNFLHVTILNNQKRLLRLFIEDEHWHFLADEQDNDGNTPLHLLAASDWRIVPVLLGRHPSTKKMSFNKENQTPLDVAFSHPGNITDNSMVKERLRHGRRGRRDLEIKCENTQKQQRKKQDNRDLKDSLQDVMNVTQVHLVVAALLVTVTFAAGFTLPGGFDSDPGPNKGMAILIRKTAFRAFVVSDAIAFACSAGAVFSYFFMAIQAVLLKRIETVNRMYRIAGYLQLVAVLAVTVAFVSGTYATLAHSVGLAATVCVITCTSFIMYLRVIFVGGGG